MVYGCRNSCVKLLFFFSNLLICIFGALIFGFSLWANLDHDFGSKLADFIKNIDGSDHAHLNDIAKYQASLWILVGVGFLLFCVGFLGCCGAACESPVLLGLFFFIVIVLTAIEIGATVFAIANREKFVQSVQTVLEKSSQTPELRRNILPIQDVFQCCGATASTKHFYIDDHLCDNKQTYDDCFTRISDMIESSGEVIVIIGFVLFAIELFSLLFSCILSKASRETRYANYYA